MPDAQKFAQEFGLVIGKKFGNAIITNVVIDHHAEIRYKKYIYNIKLTLEGGDEQSITESFVKLARYYKKIKGERNWYVCSIDPPHREVNKSTYYLTGHAFH